MSVEFIRPEAKDKRAQWKLVQDAVSGSDAVKTSDYIIQVNPTDLSPENTTRNDQRRRRAVYTNATGRTLSAMIGIAFGKSPEVKCPSGLDFLKSDVDGSGVGIINQSQSTVSNVLQTGRSGLLVDYPKSDGEMVAIDAERMGVRPTISLYDANSIMNWRTEKMGARNMLTLVVLRESYEEWSDFEVSSKTQYRVLRMDGGVYVQEVWQESNSGGWVVVEKRRPVIKGSKPWSEIPFTFIGATNNDVLPDQPPLYDLATLNIAHLNNSADHEESLFFAGQAMYWVSGADADWAEEMQKSGVYVGSRSILPVPSGGQAGLLQAQAVSGLSEEMQHKVDLMGMLGAKLIAPGEANRTATEAAANDKSSNSILSIVCDNVSDAYRTALGWVAQFAGVAATPENLDFTIGTEFSGVQFDAQQMGQALAAVQSGKLPESDFWTYCRAIGLIAADKSDDDIRDELETQGGGVELDPIEPGVDPAQAE
ncbi:hypothetical protein CSC70_03845 [Pseudoxanthomonas kalamensis DSM 18571]|uniref:DUF4055 domain-containing protein n=1 Tax=Pseudoxanthomonas kalamensis TaxID=289483 RepID=UPI0013908BA2|nr:DUF4055 domain-containing protein [Pseudoxanthomonas kalamensis]KAF1711070.1 hypothetical protein CSC70_03845 [Pseudoxanthomonas kalamensis DSM 18571]